MAKNTRVPNVIIRNPQQLGAALQRFRKDYGWPQSSLSEKSGVTQTAVSEIEAGSPLSRLETIFKLLAALDLEIVVRSRTKSDSHES
jgi:HTH-type transcriptional regulator/antitoxin HipB